MRCPIPTCDRTPRVEPLAARTPTTPSNAAPPRFVVCHRGEPQRAAVERFIADVYGRHYGARLAAFAPMLVAIVEGAEVVAAAGYRRADGPLFLERYLDAPIDRLMADDAVVARERLVEVGHLASIRPAATRRLIAALTDHLAGIGVDWVASTLTRELHALFLRLGIAATTLGPARPERLGTEAADWGSYYAHEPRVMIGHLRTATRDLRRSEQPS